LSHAAIAQTDVHAALRAILSSSELAPAAGGAVYELKPIIQLKFSDETHFQVDCDVFSRFTVAGDRKWSAWFIASMLGVFDATAPDVAAAVEQQMPQCLTDAHKAFAEFVDHRGSSSTASKYW
jgi:hypothetical protein